VRCMKATHIFQRTPDMLKKQSEMRGKHGYTQPHIHANEHAHRHTCSISSQRREGNMGTHNPTYTQTNMPTGTHATCSISSQRLEGNMGTHNLTYTQTNMPTGTHATCGRLKST